MERRKFVTGVVGSTILLTGCVGGNDDDLEDVAEEFVSAMDDGDHETVNDLIADDGEMDKWEPADAAVLEEYDVEHTNFEIVEEDDDRAEVHMTIRTTNDVTDAFTVTYELRQVDGEWKFWKGIEGL